MMSSLVLVLLTFCLLILAAVSLWFLVQQPWNVAAGLVLLCVFFYLFPALTWMYGYQSSFAYGFSTVGTNVTFEDDVSALAMTMGTTALLLIGGLSVSPRRATVGTAPRGVTSSHRLHGRNHSNEMLVFLVAAWIVLIVMLRQKSGLSLVEIVLPFRKAKADVYGSFYVLYLAMYIPLAVGAVLAVRQQRPRFLSFVCFAVSMAVALGSAQRRNVLVIVLFTIALAGTRRWAAVSMEEKIRAPRCHRPRSTSWVGLLLAGAACLTLGPILWWMRNWFTGMINPLEEIIPPWERKGFVELLFGSASAGFPTFLLVREWVALDGVQWGASLLATLCVVIPRPLWPDKPVGAELLLQQQFGLTTMPSMFLINELYLNAGLLCLPLALAVGRMLSRIHHHCCRLGSPMARIVVAAMVANLITIFKNGLGPFAVNVVFIVGLCWCGMWRWEPAARPAEESGQSLRRVRLPRTDAGHDPPMPLGALLHGKTSLDQQRKDRNHVRN
ncbi:MAG: hypothetical protein ACC628_15570 [Pirellulaceae bacterium]